MSPITFRKSSLFRYIALLVITAFLEFPVVPSSWAQVAIVMPPVGQMVHLTQHFEPPQMVGLKIDLKNPFSFDFIMDQGQKSMSNEVKKEEFNKIIKYFLVSLAMPNKDMWVNLSPYESKHMIPEVFAQTEMGRDLLAQDYVLKQFTASLMYPEDALGRKFWDKVYVQAQARFGTTAISLDTFNKVWIVADHADVYQKDDTAFLVRSHLKVMLEQDYMAIEKNKEMFGNVPAENKTMDAKTQMASQLVREIIIPAIEKEVNDGQSFAAVRQVYNAEIMATWFKKTLRESLLGQVFANRSRIAGQRVSDPQAAEKIYRQYLRAYKIGVYDYIRKDVTPDGQTIPRKYFSGGMEYVDQAMVNTITSQQLSKPVVLPTPTQLINTISTSTLPDNVRSQLVTDLQSQFADQGIDRNLPIQPQLAEQLAGTIATQFNTPTFDSGTSDMVSNTLLQPFTPSLQAAAVKSFAQTTIPEVQADRIFDTRVDFTDAGAAPVATVAPQPILPAEAIDRYLTSQGLAAAQLNEAAGAIRDLVREAGVPTERTPAAVTTLTNAGLAEPIVRQLSQGQVPVEMISQPVNPTLPADLVDRYLESHNVSAGDLNSARTALMSLVREGGVAGNNTLPAVTTLRNAGLPQPMVDQLSQGQIPAAMFNQPGTNITLPPEVMDRYLSSQGVAADNLNAAARDLMSLVREGGTATAHTPAAMAALTSAGMAQPVVQQFALGQGQIPAVVFNQPAVNTTLPQEIVNRYLASQNVANEHLNAASTALMSLINERGVATANTPAAISALTNAGMAQPVVEQFARGQGQIPAEIFNQPAAAQFNAPAPAPIIEPVQMFQQAYPQATPQQTAAFHQNGLTTQLTDIMGGAQTRFNQQTGSIPAPFLSMYANNMDQFNGGGASIEDLLAQMVEKGQIAKENLQEAIAAVKVVSDARNATMTSVVQQLKPVMPAGMAAEPLADQMLRTAISQAANKNPGGINLSDEHLTMNIKVDGKGMPLPPQYQDKALMNLNGLISIIRKITPLTQANVPALYELLK